MRAALVVLSIAAVGGLAGCGASGIPSAPIALGVPYGYRTTHVWRADLSGQKAQDVIVASEGPPVTFQRFHSMDLRVLSWDPLAHQWSVAFDAQEVIAQTGVEDPGNSNDSPGLGYEGPSTTPLLDPKADVALGRVRFVHFLPGSRLQLAFAASMNYGGSGVPGVLAIVDFKGGLANVVYDWNGEGLLGWNVANLALHAHAMYWTPTDAHCCAVGRYTWAEAEGGYGAEETSDSRPWLGAIVQEVGKNALMGTLRVTGLADKAPAAGRLHVGDLILDVLNAPKRPKGFQAVTFSIFDKVILLHPGDTVRLRIERDGRFIVVPVKLGSMRDSFGTFLPKTNYTYAAL